jgi:hypothetical protein
MNAMQTTTREQMQSRTRQIGRGALTMLALTLLTACAMPGASETERTICRELRADLPTWSQRDTPETLAAGARFIEVFEGVCG